MRSQVWLFITDFGDSAVVLPCAALVALWLLIPRRTRGLSAVWVGVVAIGGVVVAITKVLYMGWHLGIPSLDFIGLSGHTTVAFIVWPVLLALAVGRGPVSQAIGAGAGFLFAALVGFSRLMVHAHTPAEVVMGAMVGAVLSAGFLLRYRGRLYLPAARLLLLATILLPLAVGYGRSVPTQSMVRQVARVLSGHQWVYTRAELRSRPERVGPHSSVGSKSSKRPAVSAHEGSIWTPRSPGVAAPQPARVKLLPGTTIRGGWSISRRPACTTTGNPTSSSSRMVAQSS